MSARENILAKLKKADALPMEEPPVFDYYREMGVVIALIFSLTGVPVFLCINRRLL